MENLIFGTKPTMMRYIISFIVLLFFKEFCTPFNGVCTSIETSAYLTFVITSQPSDETVIYGDAASFNVTATGPEPITYQWQEDAGSGFTDINNGSIYSGATTATLNISLPIYSMNGYKYQVIVNPGGSPSLTSNFATLTVNKRAITITADSKSKIYGQVDKELTYQITSGSLFNEDSFSGSLIRDAGENVGEYDINQGTLALSSNYTIDYTEGDLTITPLPVTITAESKTKVYGQADPALTFVSSPAVGAVMANGKVISFTGSLTREAGESVAGSPYAINQGSVANSNYTITYAGANLTITKMAIAVEAAVKTKVYGENDPALTYTITSGQLGFTDTFTGALTRVSGENVGNHAILQGTLALNGNYTFTFTGANLIITQRPVTVSIEAKNKTYGDLDPALTYHIKSGSLAFSDGFTGALMRVLGENVGSYSIMSGSVALNDNYAITWENAQLTIKPLAVKVMADAQTKEYHHADPPLTFVSDPAVGTTLDNGQIISFTGELSRAQGEAVGTYPINLNTLGNSNYSIDYTGANLTITLATAIKPVFENELSLKAYPNPFTDRLYFELRLNKNDDIRFEIFDIIGTKLSTILDDHIQADQLYMLEYVPVNISSGLLIYRLEFDGRIFIGKVLYQK